MKLLYVYIISMQHRSAMKPISLKNKIKLARISIVIIFLALIRTLSEPFRLRHYSSIPLNYDTLKPYSPNTP